MCWRGPPHSIFASFDFLFLFLPVFFAVYFIPPMAWRNWPILIMSWAFHAWWRVDFLALLGGVTLFTFFVVLRLNAAGADARRRWLCSALAPGVS